MHTTAGDLWRTWIRSKVIRPNDYDKDLVQTVRTALGTVESSDLATAMDDAEWLPRNLLHAIANDLQSFSGMLQDLLSLYERVGARAATGENLRISYEFVEGEPLDVLLSNFREEVGDVRNAVRESVTPFSFDSAFAFRGPISDMADWDRIRDLFGPGDLHTISLPLVAPRPPSTKAPAVDAVIERGLRIIDAVFAMLAEGGSTVGEAIERRWRQPEPDEEATVQAAVVQAATDWWPLATTSAFHAFADAFREGRANPGLVDDVDTWLEKFESADPIEVTAERLTEVLSMPSWGMRHELYAAWITTQFDQALPLGRLKFVVVNETLRFPFKGTHLATVQGAEAAFELWCEIRSDLLDAAGNRARGIQPDYRVLRRNPDTTGTTILAVEVKQYQTAGAKRHGKTLAMYAAGPPEADVFLVGHGPIGNARSHVPQTNRARTKVFEHVRPGSSAEATNLQAALAKLLPAPLPERVELTWDAKIYDLDLHFSTVGETVNWQNLIGTSGRLRADTFYGGPEVVDVSAGVSAGIDVAVHLYSSDATSVLAAQPRVAITWVGGAVTALRPLDGLSLDEDRRWDVCSIGGDGVLALSAHTVIDSGRSNLD